VFRVGDSGKMVDHPSLERADLLVDDGQDSAGHQQFPQVRRDPPGLEGVECLMGQFDLTAAETA
jgi:hypothetical protein